LSFLWTPWRMQYIRGEKRKDCVFCTELSLPDGPDNLIVYRGSLTFVILNRFPYTCGHLMVVPYIHKASLEDLDVTTRSEIMENAVRALEALKKEYQPQGFNMGFNIGEVAGAGVLDHIHFHVVPRWGGDTNFMSALGVTRVLPELLEQTYQRIKRTWDEVN
jgi:ATP adenylyltransferase